MAVVARTYAEPCQRTQVKPQQNEAETKPKNRGDEAKAAVQSSKAVKKEILQRRKAA